MKKKLIPFKPKLDTVEEVPLFVEAPKPPSGDLDEEERQTAENVYAILSDLYEVYNGISIVVRHPNYSWTKGWLNRHSLIEKQTRKKLAEAGDTPSFYDLDLALEGHNRELFSFCLEDILGFDVSLKEKDRDVLFDEMASLGLTAIICQRILSVLIPSPGKKK